MGITRITLTLVLGATSTFAWATAPKSVPTFTLRPAMLLDMCDTGDKGMTCDATLVSPGLVELRLQDDVATWQSEQDRDGIHYSFIIQALTAGSLGYQIVVIAAVSYKDEVKAARFSTYAKDSSDLHTVSTYTDMLPLKTYGFSGYIMIQNPNEVFSEEQIRNDLKRAHALVSKL